MWRITLSAGEQAAREQTVKTTADRRLRDRCQAVLMAHRGRKRKASADDLGVHRTTGKKWLEQYRAHRDVYKTQRRHLSCRGPAVSVRFQQNPHAGRGR